MSTPKQPDESNVERGQVAPPWKRGEKTASTGMTAGEMAKAAGVDQDRSSSSGSATGQSSGSSSASATPSDRPSDRPAGPAPRGVVSGSPSAPGAPSAATRAMPASGPSDQGQQHGGRQQHGGPAQSGGPKPAGGPQTGPQPKPGPVQGPAQPPSGPVQGPQPPMPNNGPGAGSAAPKPGEARPQTTPHGSAEPLKQGPAGDPKKFVESDTRNIPREALAKKDELPDLDAIHHVEASAEGKAASRAQIQKIPSRSFGTPLRAAVQIRRVDPWSVFKVTGVLAVAGFFIWMIAVAILYGVLDGMGIWEQINSSFGTLVNSDGSSSGGDLIGTGMVFGFSALFGVVAAILATALATISAYIYNVCADMVGGVEVTLADLD